MLGDNVSVSQRLEWRETAPGLLYEAAGDGGRRYVIAAAGQNWTLDLLVDGEYQSETATDPQHAQSLDEGKRIAQEWESGLW